MPIKYGHEVNDGSTISCNICIIGAGAVGITLAKELYKKGKSVVVLESGIVNESKAPYETPRNYDPAVKKLDEGKINNFITRARPEFLTQSRTRCYGGSTNCWGGWIRPLDDYDMKDWPIKYSDLPYSDAMQLVQLTNLEDFDKADVWIKRLQPYVQQEDERKLFDADKLTKCGLKSVIIQQQGDEVYRNFQQQFGWIFEDQTGNVTLYRNATAIEFDTISAVAPTNFEKVLCSAIDPYSLKESKKFFIKADKFVLAMGGLETTRFLLLNKDKFQKISVLQNPNIGKYYMNHPKVLSCFKGGIPLSRPAEASKLSQFYGQPSPLWERRNTLVQAFVVPQAQKINRQSGPLNFRLAVGVLASPDINNLYPVIGEINFEQSPNDKSVISLSDEKDVDLFGKRRLYIDWNFNNIDEETYTRGMDFFADFLVNQMGGKVTGLKAWDKVNNWPPLPDSPNDNEFYTGDHHLGTTRMSLAADKGVVNSNLLLQGSYNLFICSTSVFPTGGWANSTLTLFALAIRLAREILK